MFEICSETRCREENKCHSIVFIKIKCAPITSNRHRWNVERHCRCTNVLFYVVLLVILVMVILVMVILRLLQYWSVLFNKSLKDMRFVRILENLAYQIANIFQVFEDVFHWYIACERKILKKSNFLCYIFFKCYWI